MNEFGTHGFDHQIIDVSMTYEVFFVGMASSLSIWETDSTLPLAPISRQEGDMDVIFSERCVVNKNLVEGITKTSATTQWY